MGLTGGTCTHILTHDAETSLHFWCKKSSSNAADENLEEWETEALIKQHAFCMKLGRGLHTL